MLFISRSGILSLACKWSCSRVGKELLAPGHEKIWFTKKGEGAEVVYKVLLEGTQWRLKVWEPFISSFLFMHVCSAFLVRWRGLGFTVWTAARILGEHWRNLPTKCGKGFETLLGTTWKKALCTSEQSPAMQWMGSAKDTSIKCVKSELKNELGKGNCVLRASAAMMSSVVAPWMSWEIQNEGMQRSPDSCGQSRDKETAELEWNHLGSSFHRLDKGDPRQVG